MKFDPAQAVLALYESDEGNRFDDPELGRLFDPPLVAVASAEDPWFQRFQQVIGPFHWTPAEALATVAPEAAARSVICWCLPVAEAARHANRRATQVASRHWAYVRTFGERMVTRMRHAMEQRLREAGFAAVAPHESPANEIAVRPGVGWSSRWSERHAAFVAGLGTFGLSGALITRRGVAHRLGSVVTELELPADHRAYGDAPFAWCLHHADGSCGACRARCPAGAIGTVVPKRDKQACFEWTYDRVRGEKGLAIYGWKGTYGCGLCQTGVPCEDRNPTEE